MKIFDSGTYALIETVKVTDGADSLAYDPAKHLFYIAAGGSDAKMAYSLIDILDTSTRKKVGDIKVDPSISKRWQLKKMVPGYLQISETRASSESSTGRSER